MKETPPCPVCGYDLNAAVLSGAQRCPECGWEFTGNDLALLGPSDMHGQPRTLKRAERRIPGWLLLLILALISATFVTLAVVLPRL